MHVDILGFLKAGKKLFSLRTHPKDEIRPTERTIVSCLDATRISTFVIMQCSLWHCKENSFTHMDVFMSEFSKKKKQKNFTVYSFFVQYTETSKYTYLCTVSFSVLNLVYYIAKQESTALNKF